jgi:hypothetical protein
MSYSITCVAAAWLGVLGWTACSLGGVAGHDGGGVGVERTVGQTTVMTWSPSAAARLREQARQGDSQLTEAIKSLRRKADAALTAGPFSVTHKKFTPPSGDLHDFSTIGRYYWPNPDTADGMPWIRQDGKTNPQYFDPDFGDSQRFVDLWHAVMTLARAYYFTGHEPYAEKATALLRVWFIDPATRMNPHARYAARFPGNWDGKCYGIHGTRQLALIADAAVILQDSPAWTAADRAALHDWMSQYLDWLLTSEQGVEEAATINNHAVAYDWLVARLAAFVGRDELAKRIVTDFATRRIAAQIEPDGSMPAELNRAAPWNYEGYALEYFFAVAILADRLGVDLWHYQSADGRSIRAALDYLVNRVQPRPGELDQKILDEVGVKRLGPLLAIAAKVYSPQRDHYRALMKAIGWEERLDLTAVSPNAALLAEAGDGGAGGEGHGR